MSLQKSLIFSSQAVQYVNKKILESNPAERDLFDILVLSNNSPESGVRIINSAKHYGKGDPISRGACFPPGGCEGGKAPQWSINGKYRATGYKGKGLFWKQAQFLPTPCSLPRVLEHTQGTGSLAEPGSLRLYPLHQRVWQHFAQPGHPQAATKETEFLKLNPRVLSGRLV